MSYSIHSFVESLPDTSATTRALAALDFLAPGEWQNVTSFEKVVELVTDETEPALLQATGERAIALWFDVGNGYQGATTIFKLVDSEKATGTSPALDAALKLGAELAAFCSMNAIPGDRVDDFVSALARATKEDAMRFSAWIALDVVLPLGPDGVSTMIRVLRETPDGDLAQHRVFRLIADHLPGDLAAKHRLLIATLERAKPTIEAKITAHSLTETSILEKVGPSVDLAHDGSYFEHTGIQSVARHVIARAYRELRLAIGAGEA